MSKSKMYDFSKFARDAVPREPIYGGKTEREWLDIKKEAEAASKRYEAAGDAGLAKKMRDRAYEAGVNAYRADSKAKDMATDPPTSEAQRGAMFAAKAGKSNIGIPQKVGAEFAKADPGGKLPARKR